MMDEESGRAQGFEERAADILNVMMIGAIGVAIFMVGVWIIWAFFTGRGPEGSGPDRDWMDLIWGPMLVVSGMQVLGFSWRRKRRK